MENVTPNLLLQHLIISPPTQETYKDKKSSGSHVTVCSFVSSQTVNNILLLLVKHRGKGGEA